MFSCGVSLAGICLYLTPGLSWVNGGCFVTFNIQFAPRLDGSTASRVLPNSKCGKSVDAGCDSMSAKKKNDQLNKMTHVCSGPLVFSSNQKKISSSHSRSHFFFLHYFSRVSDKFSTFLVWLTHFEALHSAKGSRIFHYTREIFLLAQCLPLLRMMSQAVLSMKKKERLFYGR